MTAGFTKRFFGHPLLRAVTPEQRFKVAFWLCDCFDDLYINGQPLLLPAPAAPAFWVDNSGNGYCFALSLLAAVRPGSENLADARALHQQALLQIQAGRNAGLYGDTWCDESAASIRQQLTQPHRYYPEHETISLLAWTYDVSVTLLNLVDDTSMTLVAKERHQFPLAALFARMQIGNVLVLNSKGSRNAVVVRVHQNHFVPVVLRSTTSLSCPASIYVALEMGYVSIADALEYMPSAQPEQSQQLAQQATSLVLQPISSELTAGQSMGSLQASMLHVSKQHRESGQASARIGSHSGVVQAPRSSTALQFV